MVLIVMPLSADTSFWQPLTWQLPVTRRAYCMRPEWSTCGESAWMLLSKFSWCNRLTITQLGRLLAPSAQMPAVDADLRRADRINIDMMQRTLGLPEMALRFSFCVDRQHHQLRLAETDLRYCSKCLHQGFHTAIFQWRFFTHCPIHKTSLRTGCPDCGIPISYRLDSQLADSPLRCVSCRNIWLPSVQGPAGKCTPLVVADANTFQRWSIYVDHAIGPAGSRELPVLDPTTGCFSNAHRQAIRSQETKRFAYVTTLNRLYPTPPILQSELFDRRATQTIISIPQGLSDERPIPSPVWSRQEWRRFNASFVFLESIINNAKDKCLLGTRLHEDIIRHSFTEQCVAQIDSLHRHEAATLGWCMSWYGYYKPESIFRSRTHPAFGLATWLAHLPDRPRSIYRRQWLILLADWLSRDLNRSWQAWCNIVTYMQAHGRYFLHPTLVSTADFALSHRHEMSTFTSIH